MMNDNVENSVLESGEHVTTLETSSKGSHKFESLLNVK